MSISIYYEARRTRPLSPAERDAVHDVEQRYAVEDQIERYAATGDGPNWESFCIYDPADPTATGIVFEGATKLPDDSEEHLATGVRHWCRALSEIRLIVHDADWHVHIDDVDIPWNDDEKEWDPWGVEG